MKRAPRSWPVEVQRLHRIVQAFEEMDETELTAAIHYVNARVDARLRKMREEAAKGETE